MMQKLRSTLLFLFVCSACLAQSWDDSLHTFTRNDAGASGANVKSGFYQGKEGSGVKVNYPSDASNADTWWHLLYQPLKNWTDFTERFERSDVVGLQRYWTFVL